MFSRFKKPVEESFEELKNASEELINIYRESFDDGTLEASSSFQDELRKVSETVVAFLETAKEEKAAGERILSGERTKKANEEKWHTARFLEETEEWS